MNITELHTFLRDLWLQGIELWLENDQLRFKGSKQVLAGDALKVLREHKSTIIDLLQQQPQAFSGFVLSHGQRAIYLMQSMAPDSAAYNQACLLKLTCDLDINLLESSLDVLLQRHAPLRMSIEKLDDHIAQQVSYSLPSILSVHTLPAGISWQQWLDTEADKPFNLNSEPLIRAQLLKTDGSPQQYHLLLVVHHIIADFWAMNLIIRELESIYLAEQTGQLPDLPDIGKLYKDYVLYEQEWLTSEQGQAAKTYWHQQLTPVPPMPELPTDYPRPAQQSFRGQEISFDLGSALTAQLKQQAKAAQVTPFVWVLSCYQLLMHRYSGENDIAIGSPVAGRLQKDFQLLAGHFTNPVVLRTRFDQVTSFSALLEHNKAQVLQGMKHQQYPLQLLIEELKPEHDLHSSPFFQVAISWNQLTDNPVSDGRLIDRVERMEQRGAVYQLVLTCYDKGDDIQVSWRFNSELYNPSTIERYHQHLLNSINSSTNAPELACQDIAFITDSEKQLMQRMNDTMRPVPQNVSVATLFEQTSQRFPDHIAFRDVATNRNYSYSELNCDANRIAHYLSSKQLMAGDVVALCLGRGYDMIACLLACVKSGILYIPIDTENPAERIAVILQTAGANALITKQNHALAEHTSCFIALDQVRDIIARQADHFPLHNNGIIGDDDTACIFFTSGSTGTPKGVEIPHRAIVRLVSNTNFATITEQDRFCHICNIGFDASNVEIWFTLLHGACLLYIDNHTLLNPAAFEQFVIHEKPTASVITTALFNLLVQYRADIFKDFRYMMFGGEAADSTACNLCISQGKPDYLYNVYGPTENGTYSTVYLLEEQQQGSIPIGFVVSNSQAYIYDQYDQPAAIGVIGELIVGGDGVATGYRNQPALTDEKFLPDTYRGKGKLYRTGDLAWLREDGMVMYAGRRDNQIKLRGFRIEAGDIEQRLLTHPAIQQCYVNSITQDDNTFLAAWFVADTPLSADQLKTFLHQSLPSFMIPAAFMQLEKLPLSSNGKIDRQSLPIPENKSSRHYVAPQTALQQQMVNIWQTMLGIEKIGIYDNFFELGGHSLLAVKLTSAMQAELHIDINMRMIFEYPDIASLSAAVSNPGNSSLPAVTASHRTLPVPASLSQQRLWFLQQLDRQSTTYNMPVALRFNQRIKPAVFEKAIKQLIQRHEALRTTLHDNEGTAWLHIHDADQWQLTVLDFSQMPPAQANTHTEEQISLLSHHVFDLQKGPLIKAVLIKQAGQQQILAFCLHHLIVDGWSVHVLLRELAILLENNQATLPPLALQYSDFSAWQHQHFSQQALQHQLSYWQHTLAGAPAMLNLPTDKPRPAVLSSQGAEYIFTVEKTTIEPLRQLARQHNASLFMVMLAGFAVLLSRYSQQNDICIGFPISGRNQKALEPVIGLFVNNLVIRSQLDDNTTVAQHIKNVRQSTLDAFAHQDVPFDNIIDALKLERSLSYTPLLQVSFALEEQTFAERIQQTLGTQVELLPLPWHVAKYDINLSCYEQTDSSISASLEYSTDLFEAASIERMAMHYRQILQAISAQPGAVLHQLNLLTTEEQQRSLHTLTNNLQKLQRAAMNAINRFEIQAEKQATRTALSFENQQISYQQLNQQSNRLAHVLRQKGIGSGSFVGLYLDRSPDIIISILAVLKTGAAYVPLDPYSPSERVHFIIADAGIEHIISHQHTYASLEKPCLLLEELAAACAAAPDNNLNIPLPASSSAYVIYTSGTTGKPKGCVVSHHNLARLFTVTDSAFHFNEQDVWTLFHSCAFDFSVWEIWGALLYGARLVIVPYWMSRSADAFYQLLADEQVTILNQTPSAFSQLISIDQQQALTLKLRCIIFGGEALDFTALQHWVKQHPLEHTRLINMYGITETTVHVTLHDVSQADLNRGRSIIGKPLDDLHIWLLDKHLQPAPDGITGEMYISGAGVSNGYLHRPELTAERFIANPQAASLPDNIAAYHNRLYRSGDLARRLPNGDLEYLGRSDHQVKIRGHRIELGEIEAALNQQPAIQESLVRATTDHHGHQQLHAWLLCKPQATPDLFEIRQQLKNQLPEYMIPAAFVVVDAWPLTANGKINTAALPAAEAGTQKRDYVAPRNDTELTLSNIWSEILGVEHIGVHDNFFELGGHSLLATRLAARIRTQLQCTLELRLIFENPTIEELALAILGQELDALDIDADDLQSLLQELDHNND